MSMNRREFLKKTAYYGLGAATANQVIQTLGVTNALAQGGGPGYKALVCIFFNGGNDANNMIVPLGTGPYGSYTNYANARNAQNLALPDPRVSGAVNRLVQVSAVATDPAVVPGGSGPINADWGFHPSFGRTNFGLSLTQLFGQGRLAVIANTGPLVIPFGSATQTPRQAYLAASSANKPFQLFSHSDQIQQWQSARADRFSANGWGGRIADRLDPGSTALPQVTSISGKPVFTVGVNTNPLVIGTGALNTVLVLNNLSATSEQARNTAFNFLRTVDRNNQIVAANSDIMTQARAVAQQLSVDPVIATTFPGGFGQQLRQVAKVIKANLTNISPTLMRQIFFVSIGGFDTHTNELVNQGGGLNAGGALIPGLLGTVNDSMSAFYAALHSATGNNTAASPSDFFNASGQPVHPNIPLDLGARVTVFTMSDFNRTYNPAGSGADTVGTDHSWGHHQLVMGDAVVGQRFWGQAFSGSQGSGTVFPRYNLGGPAGAETGQGGPYDTGNRGSWVPTGSVEQYANTLASWYGLDPADESHVFPLMGNFTSRGLPSKWGFMG